MAKIGVIGAGSWGTALARLLTNNGHDVIMWSIIEDEIAMLKSEHEHKDKLPGVKLPEALTFTTDLQEAVVGKEVLVLAVPSAFTRSTSRSMKELVAKGQIIVNVAKGIAATAGLVFALPWPFVVVLAPTFFITFFLTHYVSLGSLLAYTGLVIELVVLGQMGFFGMTQPLLLEMYAVGFMLAAMAFIKHKDNIKRLLHGEERKTYLTKKNKAD